MARAPSVTGVVGGASGSDPTLSSTLGDTVDTTSPYSFAPTLTSNGTLVTTITRASDASSVSVTGGTTTTPTATLTAADAALGDSFHCETVATKDGLTNTLVTTVFMEAVAASLATEIGEVSFLADMTAGSATSTGNVTIYEADGTTPKATMEITTSGSLAATWTVEWSTSYGVRIVGVEKTGGSSGTVICAITPASSVFSSADWSTDDVVAQLVYGASAAPTEGAVWYGAAPYGSLALTVNDGRDFKVTVTSSTASWLTERWGNVDSDTVVSLGSSAVPSSCVYFQEIRALGNRIKLGATDYIAPADWYSTAWDGYGIGAMLITVEDDPAIERYAAAGGYTLILATNNNDAANACSTTLRKAKFWRRNA